MATGQLGASTGSSTSRLVSHSQKLRGPTKISRWLLLFAFLCGTASAAVITYDIGALDSQVAASIRAWDLPGDIAKAVQLSEAFAHGFGVAAILGSILLVCVERRKTVWLAVLITLASGLAANGLKSCFVRIRPHAEGDIVVVAGGQQVTAADSAQTREQVEASFWDARQRSFPSGHAATAWGLAIGLSIIFPRGIFLFGILALMACLQRVVSGAHFPSDVLAGAAIAFVCGSIVLWTRLPAKGLPLTDN